MNILPKAKELWADPKNLISQWDESDSKQTHEKMIVKKIKYGGNVADIGCGAGRFCKAFLDSDYGYFDYYGFDQSLAMIRYAKEKNYPNSEFQLVDIFRYQSDRKYDTLLMIDVAYHQEEPVDSIIKVLDLWEAKRYFVSLLVGKIREDLFNSTVSSWEDFSELIKNVKRRNFCYNMYMEFDENSFAWVLLEINRE